MVNQMLFEHEAPALDDVEQGLFEGLGIHSEPSLKHGQTFKCCHLIINLLIGVNLKKTDKSDIKL